MIALTRNPKMKMILRLIASVLIVAFIAYDIAWAYPDYGRNNLAVTALDKKDDVARLKTAFLVNLIDKNIISKKVPQVGSLMSLLIWLRSNLEGFEDFKIEPIISQDKKALQEIRIPIEREGLIVRYYDSRHEPQDIPGYEDITDQITKTPHITQTTPIHRQILQKRTGSPANRGPGPVPIGEVSPAEADQSLDQANQGLTSQPIGELSPIGETVRQSASGVDDAATLREALKKIGYNPNDIDAILRSGQKDITTMETRDLRIIGRLLPVFGTLWTAVIMKFLHFGWYQMGYYSLVSFGVFLLFYALLLKLAQTHDNTIEERIKANLDMEFGNSLSKLTGKLFRPVEYSPYSVIPDFVSPLAIPHELFHWVGLREKYDRVIDVIFGFFAPVVVLLMMFELPSIWSYFRQMKQWQEVLDRAKRQMEINAMIRKMADRKGKSQGDSSQDEKDHRQSSKGMRIVYGRCGDKVVEGVFTEFTEQDLELLHWQHESGTELVELADFREIDLRKILQQRRRKKHIKLYCIKSRFRGREEIELLLHASTSKDGELTIIDIEVAPFNKDVLRVECEGGAFTIRYRKAPDSSAYYGQVTSVEGTEEVNIGGIVGIHKEGRHSVLERVSSSLEDVPLIIDSEEIDDDGIFTFEGVPYEKVRGWGKAAMAVIMDMHKDRDAKIRVAAPGTESFYEMMGFEEIEEGEWIALQDSPIREGFINGVLDGQKQLAAQYRTQARQSSRGIQTVYGICGDRVVEGVFAEFTERDLELLHWRDETGNELTELPNFRESNLRRIIRQQRHNRHIQLHCVKSRFRGREEIELMLCTSTARYGKLTIVNIEVAPFNKDVLRVECEKGSFIIRYRKEPESTTYYGMVTTVEGLEGIKVGDLLKILRRRGNFIIERRRRPTGKVPQIRNVEEVDDDGVFTFNGIPYEKVRGWGKVAMAIIMDMHKDRGVEVQIPAEGTQPFYERMGFEETWTDVLIATRDHLGQGSAVTQVLDSQKELAAQYRAQARRSARGTGDASTSGESRDIQKEYKDFHIKILRSGSRYHRTLRTSSVEDLVHLKGSGLVEEGRLCLMELEDDEDYFLNSVGHLMCIPLLIKGTRRGKTVLISAHQSQRDDSYDECLWLLEAITTGEGIDGEGAVKDARVLLSPNYSSELTVNSGYPPVGKIKQDVRRRLKNVRKIYVFGRTSPDQVNSFISKEFGAIYPMTSSIASIIEKPSIQTDRENLHIEYWQDPVPHDDQARRSTRGERGDATATEVEMPKRNLFVRGETVSLEVEPVEGERTPRQRDYKLIKLAGSGFGADVWKAEDVATGDMVALRIYNPSGLSGAFRKLLRGMAHFVTYQSPFPYRCTKSALLANAVSGNILADVVEDASDDLRVVRTKGIFFSKIYGSYGEVVDWVEPVKEDDILEREEALGRFRGIADEAGFMHKYQVYDRFLAPAHTSMNIIKDSDSGRYYWVDRMPGVPLMVLIYPYHIAVALRNFSIKVFDQVDTKRLKQYIETRMAEAGRDSNLARLAEYEKCRAEYDASRLDIMGRIIRKTKGWKIGDRDLDYWQKRQDISEGAQEFLRRHRLVYFVFAILGLIPILGRLSRKLLLNHKTWRHLAIYCVIPFKAEYRRMFWRYIKERTTKRLMAYMLGTVEEMHEKGKITSEQLEEFRAGTSGRSWIVYRNVLFWFIVGKFALDPIQRVLGAVAIWVLIKMIFITGEVRLTTPVILGIIAMFLGGLYRVVVAIIFRIRHRDVEFKWYCIALSFLPSFFGYLSIPAQGLSKILVIKMIVYKIRTIVRNALGIVPGYRELSYYVTRKWFKEGRRDAGALERAKDKVNKNLFKAASLLAPILVPNMVYRHTPFFSLTTLGLLFLPSLFASFALWNRMKWKWLRKRSGDVSPSVTPEATDDGRTTSRRQSARGKSDDAASVSEEGRDSRNRSPVEKRHTPIKVLVVTTTKGAVGMSTSEMQERAEAAGQPRRHDIAITVSSLEELLFKLLRLTEGRKNSIGKLTIYTHAAKGVMAFADEQDGFGQILISLTLEDLKEGISAEFLRRIGESLVPGAIIVLDGCSIGRGRRGKKFVTMFAEQVFGDKEGEVHFAIRVGKPGHSPIKGIYKYKGKGMGHMHIKMSLRWHIMDIAREFCLRSYYSMPRLLMTATIKAIKTVLIASLLAVWLVPAVLLARILAQAIYNSTHFVYVAFMTPAAAFIVLLPPALIIDLIFLVYFLKYLNHNPERRSVGSDGAKKDGTEDDITPLGSPDPEEAGRQSARGTNGTGDSGNWQTIEGMLSFAETHIADLSLEEFRDGVESCVNGFSDRDLVTYADGAVSAIVTSLDQTPITDRRMIEMRRILFRSLVRDLERHHGFPVETEELAKELILTHLGQLKDIPGLNLEDEVRRLRPFASAEEDYRTACLAAYAIAKFGDVEYLPLVLDAYTRYFMQLYLTDIGDAEFAKTYPTLANGVLRLVTKDIARSSLIRHRIKGWFDEACRKYQELIYPWSEGMLLVRLTDPRYEGMAIDSALALDRIRKLALYYIYASDARSEQSIFNDTFGDFDVRILGPEDGRRTLTVDGTPSFQLEPEEYVRSVHNFEAGIQTYPVESPEEMGEQGIRIIERGLEITVMDENGEMVLLRILYEPGAINPVYYMGRRIGSFLCLESRIPGREFLFVQHMAEFDHLTNTTVTGNVGHLPQEIKDLVHDESRYERIELVGGSLIISVPSGRRYWITQEGFWMPFNGDYIKGRVGTLSRNLLRPSVPLSPEERSRTSYELSSIIYNIRPVPRSIQSDIVGIVLNEFTRIISAREEILDPGLEELLLGFQRRFIDVNSMLIAELDRADPSEVRKIMAISIFFRRYGGERERDHLRGLLEDELDPVIRRAFEEAIEVIDRRMAEERELREREYSQGVAPEQDDEGRPDRRQSPRGDRRRSSRGKYSEEDPVIKELEDRLRAVEESLGSIRGGEFLSRSEADMYRAFSSRHHTLLGQRERIQDQLERRKWELEALGGREDIEYVNLETGEVIAGVRPESEGWVLYTDVLQDIYHRDFASRAEHDKGGPDRRQSSRGVVDGEISPESERALIQGRNSQETEKIGISVEFVKKIDKPTRVTFIMPMFDENDRLEPSSSFYPWGEDALRKKVEQLEILRKFNPNNFEWRIIAVDDGTICGYSTECVKRLWKDIRREYGLGEDQVTTLTIKPEDKEKMGSKKGGAVLLGFQEALRRGWADYIGYTDVDVSTDLRQTGLLLESLCQGESDVAIGSRWCKDAVAENIPPRGIISSKIYNWLVRIILPPLRDIKDTQRGFKLFKKGAVEDLLLFAKGRGLAFDTELLLLSRLLGYSIREVPIAWIDSRKASKVKVRVEGLGMLWSVIKQIRHIFNRKISVDFARRRFYREAILETRELLRGCRYNCSTFSIYIQSILRTKGVKSWLVKKTNFSKSEYADDYSGEHYFIETEDGYILDGFHPDWLLGVDRSTGERIRVKDFLRPGEDILVARRDSEAGRAFYFNPNVGITKRASEEELKGDRLYVVKNFPMMPLIKEKPEEASPEDDREGTDRRQSSRGDHRQSTRGEGKKDVTEVIYSTEHLVIEPWGMSHVWIHPDVEEVIKEIREGGLIGDLARRGYSRAHIMLPGHVADIRFGDVTINVDEKLARLIRAGRLEEGRFKDTKALPLIDAILQKKVRPVVDEIETCLRVDPIEAAKWYCRKIDREHAIMLAGCYVHDGFAKQYGIDERDRVVLMDCDSVTDDPYRSEVIITDTLYSTTEPLGLEARLNKRGWVLYSPYYELLKAGHPDATDVYANYLRRCGISIDTRIGKELIHFGWQDVLQAILIYRNDVAKILLTAGYLPSVSKHGILKTLRQDKNLYWLLWNLAIRRAYNDEFQRAAKVELDLYFQPAKSAGDGETRQSPRGKRNDAGRQSPRGDHRQSTRGTPQIPELLTIDDLHRIQEAPDFGSKGWRVNCIWLMMERVASISHLVEQLDLPEGFLKEIQDPEVPLSRYFSGFSARSEAILGVAQALILSYELDILPEEAIESREKIFGALCHDYAIAAQMFLVYLGYLKSIGERNEEGDRFRPLADIYEDRNRLKLLFRLYEVSMQAKYLSEKLFMPMRGITRGEESKDIADVDIVEFIREYMEGIRRQIEDSKIAQKIADRPGSRIHVAKAVRIPDTLEFGFNPGTESITLEKTSREAVKLLVEEPIKNCLRNFFGIELHDAEEPPAINIRLRPREADEVELTLVNNTIRTSMNEEKMAEVLIPGLTDKTEFQKMRLIHYLGYLLQREHPDESRESPPELRNIFGGYGMGVTKVAYLVSVLGGKMTIFARGIDGRTWLLTRDEDGLPVVRQTLDSEMETEYKTGFKLVITLPKAVVKEGHPPRAPPESRQSPRGMGDVTTPSEDEGYGRRNRPHRLWEKVEVRKYSPEEIREGMAKARGSLIKECLLILGLVGAMITVGLITGHTASRTATLVFLMLYIFIPHELGHYLVDMILYGKENVEFRITHVLTRPSVKRSPAQFLLSYSAGILGNLVSIGLLFGALEFISVAYPAIDVALTDVKAIIDKLFMPMVMGFISINLIPLRLKHFRCMDGRGMQEAAVTILRTKKISRKVKSLEHQMGYLDESDTETFSEKKQRFKQALGEDRDSPEVLRSRILNALNSMDYRSAEAYLTILLELFVSNEGAERYEDAYREIDTLAETSDKKEPLFVFLIAAARRLPDRNRHAANLLKKILQQSLMERLLRIPFLRGKTSGHFSRDHYDWAWERLEVDHDTGTDEGSLGRTGHSRRSSRGQSDDEHTPRTPHRQDSESTIAEIERLLVLVEKLADIVESNLKDTQHEAADGNLNYIQQSLHEIDGLVEAIRYLPQKLRERYAIASYHYRESRDRLTSAQSSMAQRTVDIAQDAEVCLARAAQLEEELLTMPTVAEKHKRIQAMLVELSAWEEDIRQYIPEPDRSDLVGRIREAPASLEEMNRVLIVFEAERFLSEAQRCEIEIMRIRTDSSVEGNQVQSIRPILRDMKAALDEFERVLKLDEKTGYVLDGQKTRCEILMSDYRELTEVVLPSMQRGTLESRVNTCLRWIYQIEETLEDIPDIYEKHARIRRLHDRLFGLICEVHREVKDRERRRDLIRRMKEAIEHIRELEEREVRHEIPRDSRELIEAVLSSIQEGPIESRVENYLECVDRFGEYLDGIADINVRLAYIRRLLSLLCVLQIDVLLQVEYEDRESDLARQLREAIEHVQGLEDMERRSGGRRQSPREDHRQSSRGDHRQSARGKGSFESQSPVSKYPVIYEVNSKAMDSIFGSGTKKFSQIQDEDLRRIKALGTEIIWFMGVWQRSPYSELLNKRQDESRVSSAYAVWNYEIDEDLGGEDEFRALVARANRLGLKVMLDVVPNHMAVDSPLVKNHPDFFMTPPEAEIDRERHRLELCPENMDSPIFQDPATGRILYFGRHENTHWADTVQFDCTNPEMQAYMREVILKVADLTNGGAIRFDTVDSTFDRGEEFWRQMIAELKGDAESKGRYPHITLLAECFGVQGERALDLGFDFYYDADFWRCLVDQNVARIKEFLKKILPSERFGYIKYLEAHDMLERIKQAFAKKGWGEEATKEAIRAAIFLFYTLPGGCLIYHGQERGRSLWIPSAILVEGPGEEDDEEMIREYERLAEVTSNNIFRQGGFKLLDVRMAGTRPTSFMAARFEILARRSPLQILSDVIAFEREYEGEKAIVVVNFSPHATGEIYVEGRPEPLNLPPWGRQIIPGHRDDERGDAHRRSTRGTPSVCQIVPIKSQKKRQERLTRFKQLDRKFGRFDPYDASNELPGHMVSGMFRGFGNEMFRRYNWSQYLRQNNTSFNSIIAPAIVKDRVAAQALIKLLDAMDDDPSKVLMALRNIKENEAYEKEFVELKDGRRITLSRVSEYWNNKRVSIEDKVALSVRELAIGLHVAIPFISDLARFSRKERRSIRRSILKRNAEYERCVEWYLMHMFPDAEAFVLHRGEPHPRSFSGKRLHLRDPNDFAFFAEYAEMFAGDAGQVVTVEVPLDAISDFRFSTHDTINESECAVKEGRYKIISIKNVSASRSRKGRAARRSGRRSDRRSARGKGVGKASVDTFLSDLFDGIHVDSSTFDTQESARSLMITFRDRLYVLMTSKGYSQKAVERYFRIGYEVLQDELNGLARDIFKELVPEDELTRRIEELFEQRSSEFYDVLARFKAFLIAREIFTAQEVPSAQEIFRLKAYESMHLYEKFLFTWALPLEKNMCGEASEAITGSLKGRLGRNRVERCAAKSVLIDESHKLTVVDGKFAVCCTMGQYDPRFSKRICVIPIEQLGNFNLRLDAPIEKRKRGSGKRQSARGKNDDETLAPEESHEEESPSAKEKLFRSAVVSGTALALSGCRRDLSSSWAVLFVIVVGGLAAITIPLVWYKYKRLSIFEIKLTDEQKEARREIYPEIDVKKLDRLAKEEDPELVAYLREALKLLRTKDQIKSERFSREELWLALLNLYASVSEGRSVRKAIRDQRRQFRKEVRDLLKTYRRDSKSAIRKSTTETTVSSYKGTIDKFAVTLCNKVRSVYVFLGWKECLETIKKAEKDLRERIRRAVEKAEAKRRREERKKEAERLKRSRAKRRREAKKTKRKTAKPKVSRRRRRRTRGKKPKVDRKRTEPRQPPRGDHRKSARGDHRQLLPLDIYKTKLTSVHDVGLRLTKGVLKLNHQTTSWVIPIDVETLPYVNGANEDILRSLLEVLALKQLILNRRYGKRIKFQFVRIREDGTLEPVTSPNGHDGHKIYEIYHSLEIVRDYSLKTLSSKEEDRQGPYTRSFLITDLENLPEGYSSTRILPLKGKMRLEEGEASLYMWHAILDIAIAQTILLGQDEETRRDYCGGLIKLYEKILKDRGVTLEEVMALFDDDIQRAIDMARGLAIPSATRLNIEALRKLYDLMRKAVLEAA